MLEKVKIKDLPEDMLELVLRTETACEALQDCISDAIEILRSLHEALDDADDEGEEYLRVEIDKIDDLEAASWHAHDASERLIVIIDALREAANIV
uniref:Uncharacterized protein n=1 Tax=Ammonifex degensii TaxID=42838 RepID=A0A7C2HU96_9THEO